MRALAAAVDLFSDLDVTPSACGRAQRARCAAAILAFPSGLILRRFGGLNSLGLKPCSWNLLAFHVSGPYRA